MRPAARGAPRGLRARGRLRAPARAGRRLARARRGAREHVQQGEVELPTLEIHAYDLDLDLVAQAVALPRVLPQQAVRSLVEAVVVVRHRRDVDKALDVDLL